MLSNLSDYQSFQLLKKLKAEESLSSFIKQGWNSFDPQRYAHGMHIDAMCEHLEAVTRGQIKRLIINVPPGTSKTSTISICWPAWTWIQPEDELSGPQMRFMFTSYSQTLSETHSRTCRTLIGSPWYQENWGNNFKILQDTQRKFATDKRGYRLATSVDGTQTGDGGKILVIDDPLNAKSEKSEADRTNCLNWWTQTMPTRLRDAKNGAVVIVMQRLHEEDLSGHIIANDTEGDWTHLCLPMRYDSTRHCVTNIWEDPRTEDGQLLCPARYGEKEVQYLERELGTYGTAGQLQQAPAPKGGGIIKENDWRLYPPDNWAVDVDKPLVFPKFEYILASCDTAYTEKQENDFSACTVWGVWRDKGKLPRLMLIEAWNERLEFYSLVNKIIDTAKRRKIDCLLLEGKASGISIYQEIKRLCATEDFSIYSINPIGDKVTRVHTCQPLFENGTIYAPDRKYVDMVRSQFAQFPKGKHDDLVDSSTQALNYMRKIGLAVLSDEGARDNTISATLQKQDMTVSEIYGV